MSEDRHEAPEAEDKPNKSTYNREYYLKNKDRLNKRKAKRYDKDKAYRLAATKRRRKQLAKERAKVVKVKHIEADPKRMRVRLEDGTTHVTDTLTLGQVAHRLGVSDSLLRKWENEGVTPPVTYRTKGGNRVYTAAQVKVMDEVYRKHLALTKGKRWRISQEFITEMHARWNALNNGVHPEDI